MGETVRHVLRRGLLAGWAILVIGLAAPALGHSVVVFATADGKMIRGEAFMRGGSPIRDAKITVQDPSGAILGETVTDENGEFQFQARYRCDHRFVADAGAGHRGEYVVPADELPQDLPTPDEGSLAPPEPDKSRPAVPTRQPPSNSRNGSLEKELNSLATQVRELRRQINKYEEKRRFQDVIGGIGYIVGVSGMAFYFLGVRRKKTR